MFAAPSSAPLALAPGLEVLGYRLVSQLGRGGFGEVWRAEGPGGFGVAVKFVLLGSGAVRVEKRSLELLKSIRHANLLPVFAAAEVGNYLVIVMELADRSLLARWEQARQAGQAGVPRDELLHYLAQAAEAIDYLNAPRHTLGGKTELRVQHRDIKPHNLLLVGTSVKVADFGLARMQEQSRADNSGHMTTTYAPPEFFRNQTSDRSDQFSLAATYCQLRGGRLPFGDTLQEVLHKHFFDPSGPDLTPLPPAERPAVARALSADPEDRWANCAQFVAQLKSPSTIRPSHPSGGEPLSKPQVQPPALPAVPSGAPAALDCLGPNGVSPAALRQAQQAWARHLDRPVELNVHLRGGVVLELVLIPPGKFCMGSPASDRERNGSERPHEVTLTRPYYLGKYELTQEQYRAVVGTNPSAFRQQGSRADSLQGRDTRRFPVEKISWGDACGFIDKLNAVNNARGWEFRLPREAEWEYACRGGAAFSRPFGVGEGSSLTCRHANFDWELPYGSSEKKTPLGRPETVGSFPANGFGLYDMHGNVAEWCHDWYGPYPKCPVTDPEGPPTGSDRVIRGGSWHGGTRSCRSASRNRRIPSFRDFDLGMRVAFVLIPMAG